MLNELLSTIGFHVRLATVEDIADIQEITNEAFQKYMELAGLSGTIEALEETPEMIQKDIATKLVLVAFLDGIPVGSVRVELFDDHTAYLSRFGVRLNYQNQGVGKALMNVVDRVMEYKHIKRLELHTASKIFSLIRFYYGRHFYIESTSTERGYVRALLCKEYE